MNVMIGGADMTEKREKYLAELQSAYASMVQALVYCETENAKQTLEALNMVSKLFFAEHELYKKTLEPYRDGF